MRAESDLTPHQIDVEATKFGLSPEESNNVIVHAFETDKRTITVNGSNGRAADFLRHLVKRDLAFPDLNESGRWEMP